MADDRTPRRERLNGRVPHATPRACEAPGCLEPGEFRAPRDNSGASARDWRWFCLEHVRAFNARYNYFDGMTPDEVYEAQTPFPTWERATRAFASNGYADRLNFEDNAELVRLRFGARAFEHVRERGGKPLTQADKRALDVLDLEASATHGAIRKRYADLVRRYHPDRNGGDRAHEARLRAVIDAYTHLKSSAAFACP